MQPLGKELYWKKLNFYDNTFSDDLGSLLTDSEKIDVDAEISRFSPSSSVTGEMKKKWVKELKCVKRGRISEYAKQFPSAKYFEGKKVWEVKCDCAFPCATQNELLEADAEMLLKNGVKLVAEGANMPSNLDAVNKFQAAKILYAPGKASNAGGVATSGLEMSQNSERLSWSREEVDEKLHQIMINIHDNADSYPIPV